jgi:hypothetical protein
MHFWQDAQEVRIWISYFFRLWHQLQVREVQTFQLYRHSLIGLKQFVGSFRSGGNRFQRTHDWFPALDNCTYCRTVFKCNPTVGDARWTSRLRSRLGSHLPHSKLPSSKLISKRTKKQLHFFVLKPHTRQPSVKNKTGTDKRMSCHPTL